MTAVTAVDGWPVHSVLIGSTDANGDTHAPVHSRRHPCWFAHHRAGGFRGPTKWPTHDRPAFECFLHADRFCRRRSLLSLHPQRQHMAMHRRTYGLHAGNPNADGAVPGAASAGNARANRWRPALTRSGASVVLNVRCDRADGDAASMPYVCYRVSSLLWPFMGLCAGAWPASSLTSHRDSLRDRDSPTPSRGRNPKANIA